MTVPTEAAGFRQLQTRPRLYMHTALRRLARRRLGLVGAALVLVFALAAVLAPVIAPYRYDERRLQDRFERPSHRHLAGTDALGRDVFSRIVYAGRISLGVSFGAVAVSTAIAVTIGLVSGYAGGRTELVLQRLIDAWMAFPFLVILLATIAVFGSSLQNMLLILGVAYGLTGSRVVRSAVLAVMQEPYIEAARTVGCSGVRVMLRHVLPNTFATVIVLASLGLGSVIIAEASLSFLGFGIPPPYPSWGAMVGGTSLDYMYRAPWLAIFPGLALSLTVFGLNVFGDALRDLLDPRLRG
jgi:peptide/nickel transport system permease protein